MFPPIRHIELLVGYLKLMNETLRGNTHTLPDAVTDSGGDDAWERTGQYVCYALECACKWWHIHSIDTRLVRSMVPLLHELLEEELAMVRVFVLSMLQMMRHSRWKHQMNVREKYVRFLLSTPGRYLPGVGQFNLYLKLIDGRLAGSFDSKSS